MFSFKTHNKDLFLIGGYHQENEQIQWMYSHHLYSVRSNSNIFTQLNDSPNAGQLPKFILLYDSNGFNDLHLYECLGVSSKTQDEMVRLQYPSPSGNFITYNLGYEYLLPNVDIKKLIIKKGTKLKGTDYKYNPMFVLGNELIPYIKPLKKYKDTLNLGRPLRIGTLFSGIGAFEEALKQLKIWHEIKFACDTGEIELVPLDDVSNRRDYKDLNRRVRNLSQEEKNRLKNYKEQIAQRNESIREYCYNLPSKVDRTNYVNNLYRKYEGEKRNYVKESYLANYDIDPSDFHTDIRFMRGYDYAGQVDILVGGSPCQSFSTYGKKQGLEDARGTLFYDYARIIKETSPRVFIYENVAAIKTNDHGHTWETMLSVWKSLGYKIFPDVLNAADYNHPQLRKRVFIVGIRNDVYNTPYEFPAKKKLTKKSTDFLEKTTIPLKYYLGKGGFTWITTYEKHKRRSRVNQDIIGCQTANQQDNWIGDFRVEHPLPEHYADPRIYIGKFDFNDGKGFVDAVGRKLTPRECLRLMGFSDNFRIVVTDHQAYHQSGNSIVVPVLKEIMHTIIPYLK